MSAVRRVGYKVHEFLKCFQESLATLVVLKEIFEISFNTMCDRKGRDGEGLGSCDAVKIRSD